ncbi:MAG: MCP four helix bundle domain-containing protein, partial [Clostridia bacterium]|nr:MCP four helix bundle domain-containing protein [Clostridia bacterium]
MKWFHNLKISKKLVSFFVLIAIIAGVVGGIGYMGMSTVQRSQDDISSVRLPGVKALLTINEAQTAVVVGERGLINRRMVDPRIRDAEYQYIEDAHARAEEAWATYESLPKTKEESEKWETFVFLWNNWEERHNEVVDLSRKKDELVKSEDLAFGDPKIAAVDEDILFASLGSRTSFLVAEKALIDVIDVNINEAERLDMLADAANKKTTWILIISSAAAMVIAIVLGLFLSGIISKPLKQMVQAANKVADGDIDVNISRNTKDEIGVLANAFS